MKPRRKFFQGELMTCVMCGKVEKSDPARECNWRVIELRGEGQVYYVCPDEFPPDRGSTSLDFQRAYEKILKKIGVRKS